MISILIPTYNYNIVKLVTTLHGQCTQQSIDYEILVLDDCSSNKELKTHNQTISNIEKCRYIENKKNRGRSASRARLAKEASFDWLLFMDADVLPKDNHFIEKYIQQIQAFDIKIISGGIVYSEKKPSKEKLLRWEYGRKREQKSAKLRRKSPFFIVTGNLLIKKEIFQELNTVTGDLYGEDLVISQHIKDRKIPVAHIENPVIHLGLESSNIFLEKSLQVVENIFIFEKNKELKHNLNKLQQTYVLYKPIMPLLTFFTKTFKSLIIKNLLSEKPNLFLFDIYKLHHYTILKRNA